MTGGCKTDNCAAKEASWAKFKVSQQVRRNSGSQGANVLVAAVQTNESCLCEQM